MGLKISRAAHRMPEADLQEFASIEIIFFKETAFYNRKHPVARGPVDAEIALRWWCYCTRSSIAPM
jgi:hypothetical protein